MSIIKRIIIIFLFLLVVVMLVLALLFKGRPKNRVIKTVPTITPQAQNIVVAETSPIDGQKNVYPGEISIWFSTLDFVNSRDDFTFSIAPTPKYEIRLSSIFPTQKVEYRVLGGLEINTTYTVTIKNKKGGTVKIFSFATSSKPPESSSAFVADLQEKINQQYYPLFYDVPYYNDDFYIDYTGRLSLKVKIKKNNIDAIKNEALEWIKSKGVDPSTHKINFVNVF